MKIENLERANEIADEIRKLDEKIVKWQEFEKEYRDFDKVCVEISRGKSINIELPQGVAKLHIDRFTKDKQDLLKMFEGLE